MKKATNIKNGNVNIKCEYCGGCGYHKMSCTTQKATVFISESGMSEFPTHHADRKIGNTDFVCDWCKRVLEITKDNYSLGAKMYDDGVEENCRCNE